MTNGGITVGADALKILVPLIVTATTGIVWNQSRAANAALANEDAGLSNRQMMIFCDLTYDERESRRWRRWCQGMPGPPRPEPPPPYPTD